VIFAHFHDHPANSLLRSGLGSENVCANDIYRVALSLIYIILCWVLYRRRRPAPVFSAIEKNTVIEEETVIDRGVTEVVEGLILSACQ